MQFAEYTEVYQALHMQKTHHDSVRVSLLMAAHITPASYLHGLEECINRHPAMLQRVMLISECSSPCGYVSSARQLIGRTISASHAYNPSKA